MSNPLDEALPYEKWAINALVAVFLLVFLGVGLEWASVDNPISDGLNQYFLDPIRGESTGDSGYNSVNTMTYAVVLGLFVVALSAWLRSLAAPWWRPTTVCPWAGGRFGLVRECVWLGRV